jgi:quercetin dioxygenase-like cupin family protein
MLTAKTTELELMEGWLDSDPDRARVRVNFPINKWTGASDSGVVYFELEPGKRLARHTDSAEEILYIVAGTAEAEVGGEHGNVSAGDLAVIPAMVPHALRNLGDDTVKVVGFFADATIVSEFEEPLMPMGVTQMEQGAPAPVAAA